MNSLYKQMEELQNTAHAHAHTHIIPAEIKKHCFAMNVI